VLLVACEVGEPTEDEQPAADAGVEEEGEGEAGASEGDADAWFDIDSATAVTGLAACSPTRTTFRWPFSGTRGQAWVINNYVDLDGATGAKRDYTGATGSAARTYDQHKGIDIDVPSFRAMDANFPVLAAAPGVVEYVQDGFYDRNTACSSPDANLVRIRHDDCSRVLYMHLKRGSIKVAVGQRVSEGQVLAVVGSSGCSTQPHLHFELRNASNVNEDPFKTARWKSPPGYSTPLSVMEITVRKGGITSVNQVKDPAPDPTQVTGGSTIGVSASAAGGFAGNRISLRILRPDGSLYSSSYVDFTRWYQHSWWWWNKTIGTARGTWRVEVLANGVTAKVKTFTVP
jgi:murein DD-endopeptidase MepM/ murein hydrolase activator NlpD